jgi:hypothetical protein
MSLSTGRTKLQAALKDLRIKFDRSQDAWDDAARDRFQSTHLEPLEPAVRSALAAMEKMADLLARARNECG